MTTEYETPEAARTRLRSTVAKLTHDLSNAQSAQSEEGRKLSSSFADLVEQLALGPEPEMRACPVCTAQCMRGATLCSNCWTKLTPATSGG